MLQLQALHIKIHHSRCKTVLRLISCLSMRRMLHSGLQQEQKWCLARLAQWAEFPWVSRLIKWGHFWRQKFWALFGLIWSLLALVRWTRVRPLCLLLEQTRHSNRHCWNWNKNKILSRLVIQLYMHTKDIATKVVSLHRASYTEPKNHKN